MEAIGRTLWIIAMAKVVREKYGKDVKIVSLSPCVPSKDDVKFFNKSDGEIQAVLRLLHEMKLNLITNDSKTS